CHGDRAVLCVSLYRRAVDNKFEIVRATYGQRSDCLDWEVRRYSCPRRRAIDVKLSFWAIKPNLRPVLFVCVEPNTEDQLGRLIKAQVQLKWCFLKAAA